MGTSVVVATTGIASVSALAGSTADMKAGLYVVKVVTASTVDVYCLTDIEFANGTDLSFVDDTLKITATPLTIATGVDVTIPSTGVKLTGGSGVIAMTIDDTAIFYVAAAHGGISEITIGKSTSEFPTHGLLCNAQKRSNGDLVEIEIFKAVGAGFPIALEETVFAIPELTVKLQYDEVQNAVARIRAITHA